MKMLSNKKAAVVGSGPNGLSAAVRLAQAGFDVTVFEKNAVPGGSCRSGELLKPGVVSDIGSAIHPLAAASPFFKALSLEKYGLTWVNPDLSLAHPLDDGTAAFLASDIDDTVAGLEAADRKTYKRLISGLVKQGNELIEEITHFPKFPFSHPLLMLRFGLQALYSTKSYATSFFKGNHTRALFGGLGIHSVITPHHPGSIAAGLALTAAAHLNGWVFPEGGAQKLTDALAGYLKELGGTIQTSQEITDIAELDGFGIICLDITPAQFLLMAEKKLPSSYVNRMMNYRYGPGVFKVDWLLDGPVPWQAEECRQAGTVHIGGSMEEILASETAVMRGNHTENPFVLVSQADVFDTTRTSGKEHVLWGYCHVPAHSTIDMTDRIERQIERFAPGFREMIVARRTMNTRDFEDDNPNCVSGDITGGSQMLRKMILPPVSSETPIANVFLCSSSTPPGPGVHGMCGVRAVDSALKRFGIETD